MVDGPGGGTRWNASLEEIDDVVFGASVTILVGFVAVLALAPRATSATIDRLNSVLLIQGGLVHQVIVLFAVGFVVSILVSPWGRHRLGGPDASPEFGIVTYFAVLFSAAIAAGIVFWGPAEAIVHFSEPPPGVDAGPETDRAATAALRYALFHWGVSVWSIYTAFGVVISYYVYSRDLPLRVSAVLVPFVGEDRLDGYPAKAVDVLGVVAPIVGTTATIGQVSSQFLTIIASQWQIGFGDVGVIIFMLAMVLVFTVSAVTGLHRGIYRFSVVNVAGFLVLVTLVFVLGPSGYVLQAAGDAVGKYVTEFVAMSTATGTGWIENWTLFYWAWWLSWGPYVGLFVARISRGRTLRTVVLVGVGATSLATMAWFLVLGATAIHFEQTGVVAIPANTTLAGFSLFKTLPGGTVMIVGFLALIVTFLVTSADSLTLSMAFLTTEPGTDPSGELRAVWGGLQAAVTTVLVLVGGTRIATSTAVVAGTVVAPVLVAGAVGMLGESAPIYRLRERTRTAFRDDR